MVGVGCVRLNKRWSVCLRFGIGGHSGLIGHDLEACLVQDSLRFPVDVAILFV